MRIFTQDVASVKIGERFGELEVMGAEFLFGHQFPRKQQKRRWVVARCSCGNVIVVRSRILVAGTSCGCKKVIHNKTHGLSHTPLNNLWKGLIGRCENPNNSSYHNYGGRGITVCQEWRESFEVFLAWALANGWKEGLQIDRKENSLGYSPENCHFVTNRANSRNRRSNLPLTAFGETKLMVEWSEDPRCTVGVNTLRMRVQIYGWSHEESIASPLYGARRKRRPNAG